MYKQIPIINIDEIINKAFSRSSNIVTRKRRSRNATFKFKEIEKVNMSAKIISASLYKVLNRFPSLIDGDPFTLHMLDILADSASVRKDLLAMRRAISSIELTRSRIEKRMHKVRDTDEIAALRSEAYGKYSSILRSLSQNVENINNARQHIIEIPPITTKDYTVVFAGFPNVGKTSLLSKLTSTKPAIAPYPFTTTGINMGTFTVKYQRVYAIDTPGLLDRPFSDRNEVERKAVSAIKYLANVLVFIFDGSVSRGYTIEEQYSLLEDTKSRLQDVPIVLVQNKIDMESEELDVDCRISAKLGTGVEEFKAYLTDVILKDEAFEEYSELTFECEEESPY